MKNSFKYLLIAMAMIIFLIPFTLSHAASKNSNADVGHQAKQQKTIKYKRKVKKRKSDKLVILNVMPASGQSREAGFDGNYAMEPTTILDSDFTLCAKASRGLIMIDNAKLIKCGGRAVGWSVGAGNTTKMDQSKHKM